MTVRILIADDDPLMCAFVAVALGDLGETTAVAGGREALELLQQQHFDLVLLDWDMPGCDGLEVLQTIRAQGCQIPILMATAKNERGNLLQAMHAGASDYVFKPFDAALLHEKAKRYLPDRRETPQASYQAPASMHSH